MAEICDKIKKEKHSDKQINLSFDEWNVWFHSNEQDRSIPKWTVAPPRLEDVYNLEDALVVGTLLITLMKNCDRVKIACLAQLVNVIAPIMTEPGGSVWKQTIFFPYLHALKYGRGTVLNVEVDCEKYTADGKEIPFVEACTVWNESDGEYVIFAVNRSLDTMCDLTLNFSDNIAPIEQIVVTSDDLKDVNTADCERVSEKTQPLDSLNPILRRSEEHTSELQSQR